MVRHLKANVQGKRQSHNDGFDSSCLRTIDGAIFTGGSHFVGWLKSADFLVGAYICLPLKSV